MLLHQTFIAKPLPLFPRPFKSHLSYSALQYVECLIFCMTFYDRLKMTYYWGFPQNFCKAWYFKYCIWVNTTDALSQNKCSAKLWHRNCFMRYGIVGTVGCALDTKVALVALNITQIHMGKNRMKLHTRVAMIHVAPHQPWRNTLAEVLRSQSTELLTTP